MFLRQQSEALRRINFKHLEVALDAQWGLNSVLSEQYITGNMRLFLKDLVILGEYNLLNIFLGLFENAYPGESINWLYLDAAMPYTLLDKAIRLKERVRAAGNPTENAQGVIKVLVENGGETYATMMNNRQGFVGTPPPELQ